MPKIVGWWGGASYLIQWRGVATSGYRMGNKWIEKSQEEEGRGHEWIHKSREEEGRGHEWIHKSREEEGRGHEWIHKSREVDTQISRRGGAWPRVDTEWATSGRG